MTKESSLEPVRTCILSINGGSSSIKFALFCYQAKKWTGALAAALGGLGTLAFAGGIGENAPAVRTRICDGLGFLGIELNEARNAKNAPNRHHDITYILKDKRSATMLIKTKTLTGYKLNCLDGEIGKVDEFYFDDKHWTIRYLVANTGNWLTGRQVLISPYALKAVDQDGQTIAVNLTKKQIEESPSLGTDKPVSRQFEMSYYGYYGWPMYWSGSYMWGNYPSILRDPEQWKITTQEKKTWDLNLRSTNEVRGYHIQATDGEIGHVEDFIIDDETWAIRYLVIDNQNWWPGKKVLAAPQWINRVSCSESKAFVNLPRKTIKRSPEYTDGALLSRDYETELHHHYKRKGYWIGESAAIAQAGPSDWSVYMEAPEYHFIRARKYLESGESSKAAAELRRGNTFLVFKTKRLSEASRKIEALSIALSTGKSGSLARLDTITLTALNVIKNKFAMLPVEIEALSVFGEAYKYHYDIAKSKLLKKEYSDASYAIWTAGSFLKLVKVSWPDTSVAELYMAGTELQELAPKVKSGAVTDTTPLDEINNKITPIVTRSK